jgi:hypothetical protein
MPALLGPEFMHGDAIRPCLQPMMARLRHEIGSALDGTALAVAERLDVRGAAEQFEGGAAAESRRDMLGRAENAPDDLHPK